MGTIIDLLEQFTNETPNTSILYDEAHTKGFTYAQFDDMTGRVYSYRERGLCPDQSSPWRYAYRSNDRCLEGGGCLGTG